MNEMKPWMQDDQVELVERILLSFGKRTLRILEWGSGGSTVYFPKLLEKKGINYLWMSLEHKEEWAEKIRKETTKHKNVQVNLFKQKSESPSSINLDGYVQHPRVSCEIAENKFDFILIDGRARARCLVEAKFLIKNNGIILLHDAERVKYHYVFPLFENGKMIESEVKPHAVWITGNYEKIL